MTCEYPWNRAKLTRVRIIRTDGNQEQILAQSVSYTDDLRGSGRTGNPHRHEYENCEVKPHIWMEHKSAAVGEILLLILRQPVRDLVVIAFLGDEDMYPELGIRG